LATFLAFKKAKKSLVILAFLKAKKVAKIEVEVLKKCF